VLTSVTHVSFSQTGGAGSVAQILMDAQRQTGRRSSFAHVISQNLRSQPLSAPLHTVTAGIDEYVLKNQKFGAPISLLRDWVSGRLSESPDDSDIVHLHNINGVAPLRDIARMWGKKKVVWTLHDMNPFTGACHYSLDCEGFTQGCGNCPAVKSIARNMVTTALADKASAIQEFADLKIVAPSTWLADLARKSTVFQGIEVAVIPNPFAPEFVKVPSRQSSRAGGEGSAAHYTFCVVAQNLSDPVKNVRDAIEAFRALRNTSPESTMALVGHGGHEFASEGISLLGRLDRSELASVLSATDALISSSRAENSPLVIIEAAAMGCRSLVRDVGGMPELITQLSAGASFSTAEALFHAMNSVAHESPHQRNKIRANLVKAAHLHYSPATIASSYDAIYESQ